MRPAFILCCARSRSTVLSAMLGCHPDIFATPELLLFTGDSIAEVLAPPTVDYPPALLSRRRSGPTRLIAQLHSGGQHPDALAEAAQWLRSNGSRRTTWLLDRVLERAGTPVVVEKSPDTTSSDQNLRRCLDYRPTRARYIHLTRHPWSVIDSMIGHWNRISRPPDQDSLARRCAVACFASTRRLQEASRPDSWLTVSSEQLLRDPTPTLQRVVEHLGLSWSTDAQRACLHPEEWTFAHTGDRGDLSGGDPTFLAAPHLRGDGDDPAAQRDRVVPHLVSHPRAVDAIDALAASLGYG